MESTLKATKAREITKESVTEAETLVVNGVPVSKPSTAAIQAGDFYFRPTIVERLVQSSWFRRVILRKSASVLHDVVTTIVISCPECGLPILTNPSHRVTQRTPLTIDGQIACPYAPAGLAGAHAFTITSGNIMPA